MAASVRRFCTEIGPRRPAAAAADKLAAVVCCAGGSCCWALNPNRNSDFEICKIQFGRANSPWSSCCCKPNAWICWRSCSEVAGIASDVRNGLEWAGGFEWIGDATGTGDGVIGLLRPAAKFHRFDCSDWTRLASFSFCVSANFTTNGAEQPSIVWLWWSDWWKGRKDEATVAIGIKILTLIAPMADCLVEKVTKAQPLLWPDGSRSTVHSSIVPWLENICLTSFSLYFLFNMPTNSLRSVMGEKNVWKMKENLAESFYLPALKNRGNS